MEYQYMLLTAELSLHIPLNTFKNAQKFLKYEVKVCLCTPLLPSVTPRMAWEDGFLGIILDLFLSCELHYQGLCPLLPDARCGAVTWGGTGGKVSGHPMFVPAAFVRGCWEENTFLSCALFSHIYAANVYLITFPFLKNAL